MSNGFNQRRFSVTSYWAPRISNNAEASSQSNPKVAPAGGGGAGGAGGGKGAAASKAIEAGLSLLGPKKGSSMSQGKPITQKVNKKGRNFEFSKEKQFSNPVLTKTFKIGNRSPVPTQPQQNISTKMRNPSPKSRSTKNMVKNSTLGFLGKKGGQSSSERRNVLVVKPIVINESRSNSPGEGSEAPKSSSRSQISRVPTGSRKTDEKDEGNGNGDAPPKPPPEDQTQPPPQKEQPEPSPEERPPRTPTVPKEVQTSQGTVPREQILQVRRALETGQISPDQLSEKQIEALRNAESGNTKKMSGQKKRNNTRKRNTGKLGSTGVTPRNTKISIESNSFNKTFTGRLKPKETIRVNSVSFVREKRRPTNPGR